jgi:predicted permease
MMAGEVALALMLVVGAGLLASSLVRLHRSGVGFDQRGIQNIAFNMDQQRVTGNAMVQFYREIGEGLRGQPGVKDLSFARLVPFSHSTWDEEFSLGAGKTFDIYLNAVAPDYFRTMRIPLFEGRDFHWDDTTSTGLKIILNKSAAKLLFANRNPIGQTITKRDGGKLTQYEVVGIVGDAKYEDLRSVPPPGAYLPVTQEEDVRLLSSYYAVVRTDGPSAPLAEAAHALATRINPTIPPPVMTSMTSTVDQSLGAERTMTLLSVFFALCALTVTAIGLYGTLACSTARRTSEIGIRMALGAQRSQVAMMIFRQNSAVALAGTAAGLVAALLSSRALAAFLYGTSARNPWIFAASIAVLAVIAVAASLLPAIRAARINPMAAIRNE